jgi:hypothetical protein
VLKRMPPAGRSAPSRFSHSFASCVSFRVVCVIVGCPPRLAYRAITILVTVPLVR